MSEPSLELQTPITVRYHREAIERILKSVEDGTYCALLGPRLCGKTVLLRHVERTLVKSLGWNCIYIDLYQIEASTLEGFFAGLIEHTARQIQLQTGQSIPLYDPQMASSAVFRGFLIDCMEVLQRDLVLIFDNLDAVPTDLVQALLTSLRAAYMDQQGLDYRLIVVVSGALSLATLTVGESSPFRGIAQRVFVGDLSETPSRDLIDDFLSAGAVSATRQARDRLLSATRGDTYLIRKICQRCVETARLAPDARLTARMVNRVTRAFLRNDVYQYAPLLEAVRLIEENPDLLRCILVLLERESVPKLDLPIPLSPDLDPLYLTGVVEQVDSGGYRLQNMIYRQFLAEHFQPGRVGHMLTMAGRWDTALDYLEAGIQNGDAQSRTDLLPATIQSMYAAQDLAQAAHFMTRGLLAAFSARQIQVWYAPPGENRLRLVGNAGRAADPALWSNPEMNLGADRLEARAYRQAAVLRGGEAGETIQRAIPLTIPGRNPVGVVMVSNHISDDLAGEQRERDLQMIGYLNQAARALLAVGTRRQELALAGRMQASLLPESAPSLPGWQITATWRPARETSGDFYDFIPFSDGRLGIILADVTDKGMGAALYMALSRTLLRTYTDEHPDSPAQVLRAANQRMLSDTHGGLFITLFYALLDPASGLLTYSNAGHHPPYYLRGGKTGQAQTLSRTGIPLGVSLEATWEQRTLEFAPGDLLLMYTDGVIEAHNPQDELMGASRLLEIAGALKHRSVTDIQDAIISGVRAFAGDEQQFDDLTLVLVKRN